MDKFDYNKMKVTADRLLDRFAQGDTQSIVVTTTVPSQSWEDPTVTEVHTIIDAVVRGVSKQYVDGVTIVTTDLQVLSSTSIDIKARIEIDGKPHAIIRHDKIPAAGTTVAHRYFVR